MSPSDAHMIRKTALTIRKHQGPLFTALIAIGIAISVMSQKQYIPERLAYFWCMIIIFVASLIETVLSLIIKESASKGLILKYDSNSILYWISVAITVIVCLLSLAGVVYYY